MKRAALLCTLALLFALLFSFAVAEETEPETFTSGDYEYIMLPDGTAEITKYSGQDAELSIPDTLDGKKVTSIGEHAFSMCFSLTNVTIPDSVTSIGNYAFTFCSNLTSMKLSDSVIRLGNYVFSDCTSLTSVTIPDNVTNIGDGVFAWCGSLTSVTIPDSVANIGSNPFVNCSRLNSIRVSPDHPVLAVIDGVLFYKPEKQLICYPCSKTETTYTIPLGIIEIGFGAFCGCSNLTSVTIPDSVTSIGNGVFAACFSLTNLTIPESVRNIGEGAFFNCENLTLTVSRDSYAAQYCKENNLNYIYPDSLDWLNN